MPDETSHRLREMPKRNPTNGTFELTVRCNLHCKMCLFRHDDSENEEIIARELTAEQWIDMARQVAEAGTMSLLITGGEPMLRPDFCEIWEGIYKQGFIMNLYTNATLVTDSIMKVLEKYPPHKIGITIYGASAGTYEKVSGNGQAFEQMVNGVQRLQQLPSEIEFRTTIIQDNCNDMIPIEHMVYNQFGDKHGVIVASEIHQSVRGACANVNACRLTPEEMRDLHDKHIIEMAKETLGDSFDSDCFRLEYTRRDKKTENEKKLSLLGCSAGMDRYTITWDGKLLACQLLGMFYLNVLGHRFLEAWEEFPFIIKLPSKNPDCKKCNVVDYCESCFASRYAETGKLNGCSPYIYKNAQSKKELMSKNRR